MSGYEPNFNFGPVKSCCVYSATEPSGHCKNKAFARGRCREHWRALRTLSPTERAQEIERGELPVRKPWEHLGDEDTLARDFGKNDELKLGSNGE
jgi:hypothetical protein